MASDDEAFRRAEWAAEQRRQREADIRQEAADRARQAEILRKANENIRKEREKGK